jgi:hypothetical protein
MDDVRYTNVAVAREVVARYRQLYPEVKLTALVKKWLEAEIRRAEQMERSSLRHSQVPSPA